MTPVPWTFEDFQLEPEQTWVVYDENLARTVAVFYDEDEARAYLKWRNKKQAKERQLRLDDDGRC